MKLSARKQVIKDVCQTCNNGPLSKLDDYGNEFILKYFSNNIKVKQHIPITYDYDKLHRWIMKIIFNGLRKDSSSGWLKRNSKYIIYKDKTTTSKFSLFLGAYVNLAPFPNMFPSIPFQVVAKPKLLLQAQKENGDFIGYTNENVEEMYVLRLCNAIFILVCWKKDCWTEIQEQSLTNILPHSILMPESHSTYIRRSTSSFNSGHLYLLLSNKAIKQHDTYMSTIKPKVN